jgi:hypothetical protein
MTVTDWRKEWFLWQYTGSGHLGGISAQVDLSRLSCPIEVFNHWYDTGELQTWNIAPTTGETAPAVPALSSVRKSLPITIGASGDDVAQVQRALTAAGFSLNDDGHFGPATRAAVMAFQKAKGLQVDGIVGAQTLAALTP